MQHFSIDGAIFREAQDCLQQILLRSATDLDFRRQLLTDPEIAIKEHLGRTFLAPLNIRFIENQADATIVLPDYHGDELTEQEQEAVSGGNGYAGHEAGLLKLRAWLMSHIE